MAADLFTPVVGGPIANTTAPTPGKGLSLDLSGSIPAGVFKNAPGYEIAYVSISAGVTATVVAEASAPTVVSAGTINFDGSTIIVEFYSSFVFTGTTVGSQVVVTLWDGSTDLGIFGLIGNSNGEIKAAPFNVRRRLTPTVGAHTYTIKAHATNSAGTVSAGAGGAGTSLPAYIRITRA